MAAGAGLEHDDRHRHLAEPLVRGRHHGALQDRRVGRERVLDVDRRDVLAAPDDDVLRAVLDQDVALLVEGGHVAGVEPAVADRRRRRVRIAVVAHHDRVAADDDLADLLAVGPHVVAVGVDDPHRDARDRPAGHRPPLDRPRRRLRLAEDVAREGDRHDRGRLGEAVADHGLHAEAVLERAHQRGRRGRAADDHLAEAREVEARPGAVVEEGIEDRRHAEQARDPVPLDRLHERGRLELAEHDVAAADHGHEVGHAPAVHVKERDHVEHDVVLAPAEGDLRVIAWR